MKNITILYIMETRFGNNKATIFENNKYKDDGIPPRIYPSKFFGNSDGLSLESTINQGYITDLKKLTPLFNQYNDKIEQKEDFSQPDNLKSVQKSLSKTEKTWPHKYYKNNYGISLEAIIKDRKEDFINYKEINNGKIRSGPFQHNRNDFGHSLESITNEEKKYL